MKTTQSETSDVTLIIDGFARNPQQMIVGQISLVKGNPYAHFKTMAPSVEEEGEWVPIGGVGVPAERFPEVRDAVHKLFEVAGERVVAKLDLGREHLHIGVKIFRGQQLAFVRRFYKKNDEWLPGRSGIDVNVARLSDLCDLADRINEAVSKL